MDPSSQVDLHDSATGAWRGVVVHGEARRPTLQVQAGSGHRTRLSIDGAPFLWARVADDDYGYAYVRHEPSASSPRVLPPFGFATARTVGAPPGSEPWFRRWSAVVGRGLAEGPNASLARGATFVGPCGASLGAWTPAADATNAIAPPAAHLARALTIVTHDFDAWGGAAGLSPLPLRCASRAADARVVAFRKLARDGVLAPIVLRWVACLQRYVVLDGHDRLKAALLEDVLPTCLAVVDLRPVRDASASAVATTRAWPLEGGASVWTAEARAALAARSEGDPVLFA